MVRLDALTRGWFDYRRKRFWACVLLAGYALVGFVIAPLIVRNVLVEEIHTRLGLTATLDDVAINPFALSARLGKFSLADRGGANLVAFESFVANVQLSSIVNRALTFSELRLVHPHVSFVRDVSGQLNLMALVPPDDGSAKPVTAGPMLRLIIANATIEAGRVSIVDRTGRQPFETELGPVDLQISNLSAAPNQADRQTLVIQTRSGGRLEWSGEVGLQPLRAAGHITLTGQKVNGFSAYLPAELSLWIVDGSLDVAFDFDVTAHDNGVAAGVSNLSVALNDLGLAQGTDAQSHELLRLSELAIQGGRIAWPERSLSFQRVGLMQPQVALGRDPQNQFTWESLWRPAALAETAPSAPLAEPAAASQPWSVAVAKFDIAEGVIGFDDGGVDPPARLLVNGLAATLDGFSLAADAAMPFTLNFNVDGGGTVALDGTLTALPVVKVDAMSQISGLALTTANPYLRADTFLQLVSGALGVNGHLVSNAEEAFGFDGELRLSDVEVRREGETDRFAGLKRLDLSGITLSSARRQIDVARGELDSAFAKIHIGAERTVNIANVLRTDTVAAPAAESAAAEPPWSFKLARMKVTNGDADFSDESLPLPFRRTISKLTGDIDALDTSSRAPTQLKLDGQVGEFGELRLSGYLSALDPLRDTDISAKFRNVEMPGASAYAIRFAGHKVASGRLDLDLRYKLDNGVLDGSHKIVLRDFELGEKVDYPEALDLPYGLAISLLKDSSGNIDINLPVYGDMNDPTFRIGGVIMKALGNVIGGIVTAPFRLLGRLVGLGDSADLDRVYFEPGRSDLAPPEREKIAKIADALVMRPKLVLVVHGASEPLADASALRQAALRARIDALVGDADAEGRRKIIQEMVKQSIPDLALEPLREKFKVAATPGAEPVLDDTAYLNALVQKLNEVEPLAPDAVEALAAARAASVRAGLIENASLDQARIIKADVQMAKPAENGAVAIKLDLKMP